MSFVGSMEFTDFLLAQVPLYDSLILEDIRLGSAGPIGIDARLLPNKYRRVWRLRYRYGYSFRKVGRRCRLSRWRASRYYKIASLMMAERFKKWMKSLPDERKEKEEARRGGDPWIMHIPRAVFPTQYEPSTAFDRFHKVFPVVKKEWESQFPPSNHDWVKLPIPK